MSESYNTKKRRELVKQVITNEKISTQEELASRLRMMGIKATQSTVSRDIQDLRLIKVGSVGNRYYALPAEKEKLKANDAMVNMYKSVVTSTDRSTNMISIHTASGMAQALCATMDKLNWDGILGTLAGDDTVLIITRSESIAMDIMEALSGL